jgi:hypothetical protein
LTIEYFQSPSNLVTIQKNATIGERLNKQGDSEEKQHAGLATPERRGQQRHPIGKRKKQYHTTTKSGGDTRSRRTLAAPDYEEQCNTKW